MNRISYHIARLNFIIIVLFSLQFAGLAESKAADDEVVKVSTIWSVDRAHPGDLIVLAIVADITSNILPFPM